MNPVTVLLAAITRLTSVEKSVVAYVSGYAGMLKQYANEPDAIMSIAAEMEAQTDAFATAVVANTPAAPASSITDAANALATAIEADPTHPNNVSSGNAGVPAVDNTDANGNVAGNPNADPAASAPLTENQSGLNPPADTPVATGANPPQPVASVPQPGDATVVSSPTNAVPVPDGAPAAGSAGTAASTPPASSTPSLSALSPTSGPAAGGNTVTLTGSGFTGATGVSFGADMAPSFTVLDDNSMTAIAPIVNGSGGTSVSVVSLVGNSNALSYSYV